MPPLLIIQANEVWIFDCEKSKCQETLGTKIANCLLGSQIQTVASAAILKITGLSCAFKAICSAALRNSHLLCYMT